MKSQVFTPRRGAMAALSLALSIILPAAPGLAAGSVDDAALKDMKQSENWLSYGRNYSMQRYSPLEQINAGNAGKLGLEWSMALPDDRSLLATPLVVDGVMYFTGSWSKTRALDAKTGKLLWEYDPESIKHAGDRLRIMWDSSRGLAYWKGKLVIATIDGRLIGLDAKTGKKLWSTQTFDPKQSLYISGYPTAFRDLVIIGNGGSEFGGGRGFVSAYHIDTGKPAWKFYVVPGNPADGFEDETQAMAAKTWKGEWWKKGGGGQTWNGFTYDPEYDQILIGTGNGGPWNQKARSPGGGDNLFLCSIVALDAKTGKYKWHYQTVPGETWDYNSSMDIVLSDLKLKDGKDSRKVLLHAPKNGFFYVVDRKDGKLLSAEKFAEKVTWASGIDMKTGRPIEREGARYEDGEELIWPSVFGAHNYHAMSFNPKTGLVYIPKTELPSLFKDGKVNVLDWTKPDWKLDLAVDMSLHGDIPKEAGVASLLAWDPVNQKKVWEIPQPSYWNPGTVTTAGNLVFQGRIDGKFAAYDALSGKEVWSVNVGSGISAPPITYSVGGKQYVSLLVGWGGAGVSLGGGSSMAQYGWGYRGQTRQLLTFALDGKAALPDVGKPAFATPIVPADFKPDPAKVERGSALYTSTCVWCHSAGAVSGGYAPDLRASQLFLKKDTLRKVLDGALVKNGMPKYAELTDADLEALQHYVRNQAIVTTQQAKQ
ncbi:PQQ-dependent dehydrogenase, methanol/ethanol family [Methyloversatilis sp. XJ19-13]|uniref:PQQ-dependent dehydrogenase, methanol/ethanol family n=1 Tax=Methyloversatilis sp. XJ19-13 TaxID=2963430 RepID=UPI00211BED95|nr:PQQ-dependent dehydrogenase, methanol/ethanol family [Methyloversatilis sp. XJ19-13]MCQ9374606.1 PQQ-dependent dehydrogenase, methanol/ethanol family [Methyloversatilis sp. XJ19-13]